MKINKLRSAIKVLAFAACVGFASSAALARDHSGNSAPPSAEADNALPRPTPPFKGKIGKTYKDSVADFPQPLKAPKGAPNVVVILLDDVGFGQPGTFGGPIPTPNLDKLASEGLRYNTFHTTGICSPTRAAVLTGHNHHQVGFGTIAELSTGFPGYDSVWPLEATTVAEVLKENGYESPRKIAVCM
jgi:hypothetical protein